MAEYVPTAKSESMQNANTTTRLVQLAEIESFLPMTAYLMRALREGGNLAKTLLHTMTQDTESYLDEGLRAAGSAARRRRGDDAAHLEIYTEGLPTDPGIYQVLRVQHGRKKKWTRQASHRLNLQVTEGEVHGHLEPNGAGKSAAIQMPHGLVRGDTGTVRSLGGGPGPTPSPYIALSPAPRDTSRCGRL